MNELPKSLSRAELIQFLKKIRQAVREHRDQIGDYRCWVDDEVLYHRVLPECEGVAPSVPSEEKFSAFCQAYYEKRQDPSEAATTAIPLDSSKAELNLVYDAKLDADLEQASEEDLRHELNEWYLLIRSHSATGQIERTYQDDQILYQRLPERTHAVTRLPPRELFLGKNCPAYNKFCQTNPDDFAQARWRDESKGNS